MEIIERVKAPTPKFFRTLRTIGLTLASVGGIVLTAPVSLPAALLTIAGYLTVAGGVMGAVSQAAVEGKGSMGNEVGSTRNEVRGRKVKGEED